MRWDGRVALACIPMAGSNVIGKAFRRVLLVLVAGGLAGTNSSGCNTFKGVGMDLQAAGRCIHNAAENAQERDSHRQLKRITASADAGGTISPSGSIALPRRSSQTFIATANAGYRVEDIFVDGRSVGALPYLFKDDSSSYTFYSVTLNHAISASFDLIQCECETMNAP